MRPEQARPARAPSPALGELLLEQDLSTPSGFASSHFPQDSDKSPSSSWSGIAVSLSAPSQLLRPFAHFYIGPFAFPYTC